jgi:hypothetical protein
MGCDNKCGSQKNCYCGPAGCDSKRYHVLGGGKSSACDCPSGYEERCWTKSETPGSGAGAINNYIRKCIKISGSINNEDIRDCCMGDRKNSTNCGNTYDCNACRCPDSYDNENSTKCQEWLENDFSKESNIKLGYQFRKDMYNSKNNIYIDPNYTEGFTSKGKGLLKKLLNIAPSERFSADQPDSVYKNSPQIIKNYIEANNGIITYTQIVNWDLFYFGPVNAKLEDYEDIIDGYYTDAVVTSSTKRKALDKRKLYYQWDKHVYDENNKSTFDGVIEDYCNKYQDDPLCACHNNPQFQPNCFDIPCSNEPMAWKLANTPGVDGNPCSTYIDCSQQINFTESDYNNLTNVTMEQNCNFNNGPSDDYPPDDYPPDDGPPAQLNNSIQWLIIIIVFIFVVMLAAIAGVKLKQKKNSKRSREFNHYPYQGV